MSRLLHLLARTRFISRIGWTKVTKPAAVARVLSAARETGSAAAQVQSAASELATQSLTVKREVDSFVSDIQAA